MSRNRYLMSIIGGIVCTVAESFVIHFIQIFYPHIVDKVKDTVAGLIPGVAVFNISTGLLSLAVFSMIVWSAGFYLIFKSET